MASVPCRQFQAATALEPFIRTGRPIPATSQAAPPSRKTKDYRETIDRPGTVELAGFASSRWIVVRSHAPRVSSISCCVPVRYKDSRVSPLGDSGI